MDCEKLNMIEDYVHFRVDNNLGMPIIELLSSKWHMRILFHLGRTSPMRFGELRRKLRYISNAALANALQDLQDRGLITRCQYNELTLRAEYSITDLGEELLELNYQITVWEKEHFPADPKKLKAE